MNIIIINKLQLDQLHTLAAGQMKGGTGVKKVLEFSLLCLNVPERENVVWNTTAKTRYLCVYAISPSQTLKKHTNCTF